MSEEDIKVEAEESAPEELEIIIEDDTPEEDRGRPRLSDEEMSKPVEVPDEELANYTEGIQKRIKQLTHRFHEERRRKEEAERERDESLTRFKSEFEKRQKVEETLAKGENILVDEAKSRVDAELNRAESDYKSAYESGDTDSIVKTQRELARLEAEKVRLNTYRPKEYVPEQLPEQSKPKGPEPTERDKQWLQDNPWYQNRTSPTYGEMTAVALAIHEAYVTEGGVPGSEAYYNRINEGVRKRFPEQFSDTQKQPANVVAPAGRANNTSRSVRLTETQIRLCNRLGLTHEQYARQFLKDM